MSRTRTLSIAGGLALAIFLTRLPYLGRDHPGSVWNGDELEMSLTVLDRFLGTPHTGEHWSGAPLQLTAEPMLGALFLAEAPASPEGLTTWLSAQYRAPWRILGLVRVLTALMSSLGLAALYPVLRRQVADDVAIAAVAVLATVPYIWAASVQATPGGFAIGWLMLAIAAATLDRTPRGAILAGAATGIAIAGRLVIGPAVLFILAVAADAAPRDRRRRRVVTSMLAVVVAFVAVCPYVWIEPVRFVKATLGNVVKRGVPSGPLAAIQFSRQLMPLWLIALAVIAIVMAMRRRQYVLMVGGLAAAAVTIGLAARGPILETRYFLAMPLVAGVFVFETLAPSVQSLVQRHGLRARAAVWILVAAIVVGNAIQLGALRRQMLSDNDGVVTVAHYVRQTFGAGARLAIPDSLDWYVADLVSSAATTRLADAGAGAVAAGTVVPVMAQHYGVASRVLDALRDDFNEDERAATARWRIRAVTAPAAGFEVLLHSAAWRANRVGMLTTEEAIARFDAGQLDALVLEDTTLPGRTPVFTRGDFRVYRGDR